jgi:hypothetical protein
MVVSFVVVHKSMSTYVHGYVLVWNKVCKGEIGTHVC